MPAGELLLELLSEEIPARMQRRAIEDLVALVGDKLAAAEILPELLRAAIGELPWPKSMRFPASSLRWVRPLTSVICLFDGAVLPLALDQIPVGRTTRGHRFLSEGEIPVENAQGYREKLEAAHVILDHDRL